MQRDQWVATFTGGQSWYRGLFWFWTQAVVVNVKRCWFSCLNVYWPILPFKVLWQAGPDIGDMELRRSMLEPEVASNSFYVFMVAIFLISSFLQEEDFRPASEVFGKGAMDLDYLNQVKPKRNCFEIYYCWVSRLTGVFKHGSGSSSVSHLARQSLYQKVRFLFIFYMKVILGSKNRPSLRNLQLFSQMLSHCILLS